MAFSETQKVDIRFYLGYPDVYRYANPRLESAIEVVGTRPESQARVEIMLAKLNGFYGNGVTPSAMDQQIARAGISKVESADDLVEFGGGNSDTSSNAIADAQSSAARRLVSALSSFFGIPIASDVFGTRGYVGDNWKFYNGNSSGFGFNGFGFGR